VDVLVDRATSHHKSVIASTAWIMAMFSACTEKLMGATGRANRDKVFWEAFLK
jgi:hypothetical protein